MEIQKIKRCLKRKIKITESLLVLFMITGTVSLANVTNVEGILSDNIVEQPVINLQLSNNLVNDSIIDNTGLINNKLKLQTKNNKTTSDYVDVKNSIDTLISGNSILTDLSSISKFILNSNGTIKAFIDSLTGDIEVKNIFGSGNSNNSIALGNSGNGVFGVSSNSNINNKGFISGKIYAKTGTRKNEIERYYTRINSIGVIQSVNSGNGVLIESEKLSDINNDGVIKGETNLQTGVSTIIDLSTSTTGHTIQNQIITMNSGNGISITNSNLNNTGLISGKSINKTGEILLDVFDSNNIYSHTEMKSIEAGNGVVFKEGINDFTETSNLNNSGLIQGYQENQTSNPNSNKYGESYIDVSKSANGLLIAQQKGKDSIFKLDTNGTIRGILKNNSFANKITSLLSGNGIALENSNINLNNKGLVLGTDNAINGNSNNSQITNNGILAGKNIFGNENIGTIVNNGIYIKLNDDYSVSGITIGSTSNLVDNKEIINIGVNGDKDSYKEVGIKEFVNKIINGVGMNSGVLTINNGKLTLNDTVLNAYQKAIQLNGNSELIATNSTFNGGGIFGDIPVIIGDNNNNTVVLNTSIVNGSIDLSNGNDELNINNTQLNGDLLGGLGSDTLTLSNINIFNQIKDFEKINIVGTTTLFEDSKILNGDLSISDKLNLRLDPLEKDENGYIKGHALYNHTGNITFKDTGKLTLGLNGLSKGSIVAMNGTNIINPNNPTDLWWKDNRVDTNSLVLDAKIMDNGNIQVAVKELIDLFPPTIIPPPAVGGGELPNIGVEKKWDLVSTHEITQEKYRELEANNIEIVMKDNKYYALDRTNNNAYGLVIVDPPAIGGGELPNIGVEKKWDLVSTHEITQEKYRELEANNIEIVMKDNKYYALDRTNNNAYGLVIVDPQTIKIDNLLYEKLNKIYKSIVSSEEIGKLANTTLLEGKTYNESLGGLLTLLDQMYANNPYAYTLKSSKDSLKLFEDNLSYLTIKPQANEWLTQGRAIYSGVKTDNESSGRNYYGFDTGHRNYKTTTSTVGGIATYELGLNDNTSIGFALGGNNQNINYKGSSKIKGNSLYLGAFSKTNINNFRLMTGIGYQYTKADVDRNISNKYDSLNNNAKYNINSLNAFTELKYEIKLNDSLSINPKGKLSLYHISQDNINEEYKNSSISMKVDEANNTTIDLEVGFDVIKSFYTQTGKLNSIVSLSGIQMIGDESKELNGYILGNNKTGSKFDIQGSKLSKTSGQLSYDIEYEKNNGIIYTVGTDYTFSKSNKNLSASLGIGYKFNKVEDLVPVNIINTISLSDITNFGFNSFEISAVSKEKIKSISKELDTLKNVSLDIKGYTDSIGTEEYNQKLSEKRADSVKKEFEKNTSNLQIKASGYGETNPLVDNLTEENRKLNRRVEINVIGEEK